MRTKSKKGKILKKSKESADYIRTTKAGKPTIMGTMIDTVISLYKEGYSAIYVKDVLRNPPFNKSDDMANKVVTAANVKISDEYVTKIATVKSIHVARYNRIITATIKKEELSEEGIGVTHTWEQFLESRYEKKKDYEECLDALSSKERSLKMHSPTFVITEREEVDITEKKNEIKINKLTIEEQVELLYLLQKVKAESYDFQSVTAKILSQENIFEDIESVVVESKTNIEEIEQITPITFKPLGEPVSDPTRKLREALAREAESKLNNDNYKKGSKIIIQKNIN